jgi:transposase
MTVQIRIKEDARRDEELMWSLYEGLSYRQMADRLGKSIGTVQQGLVLVRNKGFIEPITKNKKGYWRLTEKGLDKLRSLDYEIPETSATD